VNYQALKVKAWQIMHSKRFYRNHDLRTLWKM